MFIFPKLQSPIMWINIMTDGCSTTDRFAGAMVEYPENYMGAAHRRNRKEEIRLTRKVVFVNGTKGFPKKAHFPDKCAGGG
jgi:hypothetical protein